METKVSIKTGFILLACALMASTAYSQVSYWRCVNPPDLCVAFIQKQKDECPECKEWVKRFLEFSTVAESARVEQRASGIRTSRIASNFFLDAASETLYGFDFATVGPERSKTREIYAAPEKYGLHQLREDESKIGALAIIGDVAGIATEVDGELKIAYPSAKTGKIEFASPETLANSEKAEVKYVAPVPRAD
jgi:hypothetical protein